ncbi:MAG: TlpA family protein disulfide reductase [Pirellulales bacterium]|nr:TlpA family protein disulfide reductase [Pirellulales bacterium]
MSVTRKMRSLATLAAVVPLIAVGCAKEEANPAGEPAAPPASATATSAEESVESETAATESDEVGTAIKLTKATKEDFDSLIASHRGKVVLVDYWATWCGPCVKGFPHTVELAEKLAPQGLAVISVSFDDPEASTEVEAFLTRQHAQFDNLISAYGAEDQSYDDFGVETGALPHYQIYDREGKLVRELVSGDPTAKSVTPEDVAAAVQEQLDQPAAANP